MYHISVDIILEFVDTIYKIEHNRLVASVHWEVLHIVKMKHCSPQHVSSGRCVMCHEAWQPAACVISRGNGSHFLHRRETTHGDHS